MMQVSIDSLRSLSAMADMGDAELERLLEVAPPRAFEAGWPLYEEGSSGRSCLLITSGEVEVSKRVGLENRTIARIHAGVLVGQGALIDRSKRLVTLTAVVDTTALVLDRATYRGLLTELDPLALRLQRQLAIAGIRQLRAATFAVARVAARLDDMSDPMTAYSNSQSSAATTQAALHEWSIDVQRLLEH